MTTYLDDVVVFNVDPNSCMPFIGEFVTIADTKSQTIAGATMTGGDRVHFLGHFVSPSGVSPTASKFAVLAEMSTPKDIKQLRYITLPLLTQEVYLLVSEAYSIPIPVTEKTHQGRFYL